MEESSFYLVNDLPRAPGYYEIYVDGELALKCGISTNLRRRLRQHASSHQNGLKLVDGGDWHIPAHVWSKRSVLTKHLYYDQELEPGLDFTIQLVRREFLLHRCIIRFVQTPTKRAARQIEVMNEMHFRYFGPVQVR